MTSTIPYHHTIHHTMTQRQHHVVTRPPPVAMRGAFLPVAMRGAFLPVAMRGAFLPRYSPLLPHLLLSWGSFRSRVL